MLKQITLAASMLLASAQISLAEIRLIMVDQPGCAYCAAWLDEIGPAYPNTAEGRFAPLLRANLREGPPVGVKYARRVSFTPTFILIENGAELARIEGYPGEDFFWPIFTKLLEEHSGFEPLGN